MIDVANGLNDINALNVLNDLNVLKVKDKDLTPSMYTLVSMRIPKRLLLAYRDQVLAVIRRLEENME